MSRACAAVFNNSVILTDGCHSVMSWLVQQQAGGREGRREVVPTVEGRGTGLRPAPPDQLGLEGRFGPCLCGGKGRIFWRLRVAFMLALRCRCWKGFYDPPVSRNGQPRVCCGPGSFDTQGLCRESKADAWSSAPERHHSEIWEQWRSLV